MNATRFSYPLFPLMLLLGACASAPKPTPTPTEAGIVSGRADDASRIASAQAAGNGGIAVDSHSPAATATGGGVAAPAEAATDAMATDTATSSATAISGPETAASHDPGAVPSDEEADFEALYGSNAASGPADYDPWERFNREMHGFNNAIDHVFLRPVARGYTKVTPKPVRTGIGNFFSNLRSPSVMVNQLLQGHPIQASKTLARFLINSTLGIGGILDPASDAKLPPRNADFGQTLGVWGWNHSRYLVLPFFGPRTVRDSFGLAADSAMSPTWHIENDKTRIGTRALGMVDTRAQLLPLDDIRAGAVDDYSLIRDAWMQRRRYLLQNSGRPPADQGVLPDYMNEDVPDQGIP